MGKVEPNGTPRLFGDRFFTPNGKARFHAVRHGVPAEEPDREYPIYLTTGRTLAQYQSGTQTRRIDELVDLAPEPFAELHPRLASRHRVKDGDTITLATRRGRASFVARVTNTIQRRHRVRAVPLERPRIGQSPDQSRARSHEPHA